MAKNVKYVQHGGELSYPAPVVCDGGYFYNFLLQGKRENLIELCNRVFNTPSGGEVMYYPLSHVVMMTVGAIPKIYSSTENVGYSPEKQVILWLFLARVKKHGKVMIAEKPVLFPAYTLVPDVYSLISGREVFGFFKSYGWVDVPDTSNVLDPPSVSLDVFGLKNFGPDEEAKRYPLLEFTKNTTDKSPGETWTNFKDLFKALRPHIFGHKDEWVIPGLKFGINLFDDLIHKEVPLVFLKQFRAATANQNAIYQSIIEAPCPVSSLHAQKMGDYKFSILDDLASYPLAKDIGLENQDPLLSLKVLMDFQINGGTEVWNAFNS